MDIDSLYFMADDATIAEVEKDIEDCIIKELDEYGEGEEIDVQNVIENVYSCAYASLANLDIAQEMTDSELDQFIQLTWEQMWYSATNWGPDGIPAVIADYCNEHGLKYNDEELFSF